MTSTDKIRIGQNTNADEVRRQLSNFSWFSKVEASTEENGETKIVVLHEVTLGQRLSRLFQSSRQRSDSVDESRRAMRTLANTHPAINALLGSSINQKSGWSVAELRQALTVGLVRLAPTEHGKKLAVPLTEGGQVDVANAKISDIKSDSKVSWGMRPQSVRYPTTVSTLSDQRPYVEVTVTHPADPTIEQIAHAYRDALNAASGHVVIAPIKDLTEGYPQSCSDQNLRSLLEAIDEAKKNNSKLTAVTIATREYADKDLASRIEDLQAQRKSSEVNFNKSKELGRFTPPHGRQVPDSAGIHFLTNSPFNLQANRIILPTSVASLKGYECFPEVSVGKLPQKDTGRLIGFNDTGLAGDDPKKIQERFGGLIANMAGTVVISPPPLANKEQLQAMMSAVIDACEKNQSLSVSFATEETNQREALTNAFVAAKQARQDAQELDIDADPEEEIIVFADLWKKA